MRESAYLGMFRFVRVSPKSAQKTLPRLSRDLPKISPTLFSISPSCSEALIQLLLQLLCNSHATACAIIIVEAVEESSKLVEETVEEND